VAKWLGGVAKVQHPPNFFLISAKNVIGQHMAGEAAFFGLCRSFFK
jgi:hypothetical protein